LWGNLKDGIPELTLSTIQYADKVVRRIVKDENWLSLPTQDVTRLVHESADLFKEKYADKLVTKSMLDYEKNKSKTYITAADIEISKKQMDTFKSVIRGEIRQFLSDLDISKPVIAGVRNAIIQVGLLDNSEEINDNVYILTNVRKSLAKEYRKTLQEFYGFVEQKISQYLEEDLNGAM